MYSHTLFFSKCENHDQGILTMKPQPAVFEEYKIRRVYDEDTETGLFLKGSWI